MTTDDRSPGGFSLRRWSQRKLEATRAVGTRAPDAAFVSVAAAPATSLSPSAASPPPATPGPTAVQPQDAPSLPPVESLTIDSDFTAFLDPKVDQAVKRQALKKLFSDPRFNVMDGLDVYIDDYSIADPIAPELARQLAHARYIFDPPRTRVNEAGIVEEVPADEAAPDADGASQEAQLEAQTAFSPPAKTNAQPEKPAEAGVNLAQPTERSEPAR